MFSQRGWVHEATGQLYATYIGADGTVRDDHCALPDWSVMNDRIVQLVPWRDCLLALTEQGEVYRLNPDSYQPPTSLSAMLLFPGLPKGRE